MRRGEPTTPFRFGFVHKICVFDRFHSCNVGRVYYFLCGRNCRLDDLKFIAEDGGRGLPRLEVRLRGGRAGGRAGTGAMTDGGRGRGGGSAK
jgi:hypothetical protein